MSTTPAATVASRVTATARGRAQWLAPAALILLSLIPVIAGAARLTELSGGAVATAQNARFLDSPIPVVIHIITVTVYSLLGAFQFVPALRRGRRRWHRMAGRILIPAGLLAALSGLWMSVFYPHVHGHGDLTRRFSRRVRVSHGAQHRARDSSDRAARLRAAQRVDDARLCHRDRRGHSGTHSHPGVDHLRLDPELRRGDPHGGRMGDQPRGRRIRHTTTPSCCSEAPSSSDPRIDSSPSRMRPRPKANSFPYA